VKLNHLLRWWRKAERRTSPPRARCMRLAPASRFVRFSRTRHHLPLYDYGRPRELHIEQAAAIADLSVHPGAISSVKMIRGNGWFARSTSETGS